LAVLARLPGRRAPTALDAVETIPPDRGHPATSDRPVPAEWWTAARERCDEWNCENRWPKAYLWIKSDDDRQIGIIELGQDLPVECGARICMLDDFTSRVIRGCCRKRRT